MQKCINMLAVGTITFASSCVGAGVIRVLYEGRNFSIYDPAFKQGILSGGIPLPLAYLTSGVFAIAFKNKINESKLENLIPLVGLLTFISVNTYLKEEWETKILSNVGGFLGVFLGSMIIYTLWRDSKDGKDSGR